MDALILPYKIRFSLFCVILIYDNADKQEMLVLAVIVGEATQISLTRAQKQKYKCRLGRAGLSEKERRLIAGAVLDVLSKRRPKYNCYLELPALLWVTNVKLYFQYLAAYGPTSSERERWKVVDATFRSKEKSRVMLEKAIMKSKQQILSMEHAESFGCNHKYEKKKKIYRFACVVKM